MKHLWLGDMPTGIPRDRGVASLALGVGLGFALLIALLAGLVACWAWCTPD